MYGTIPLAASFSLSGMEDDRLAAFMMSSILLDPQLLLYGLAPQRQLSGSCPLYFSDMYPPMWQRGCSEIMRASVY